MPKYLILIFIFYSTLTAFTQKIESPLEVSKKVFALKSKSEIIKYSTGEYLANDCSPNGTHIKDEYKLSQIYMNDSTSLVEMIFIDSLGKEFYNAYIYLKKYTTWKISALRENSLFEKSKYDLLNKYKNYSDAQMDSICKSDSDCNSIEDLRHELTKLELKIAVDNKIINFFKENILKFNELLELLKRENNEDVLDNDIINRGKKLTKELFVQTITDDSPGKGCYLLSISPGKHHQAGYLYIESENALPIINPDSFFVIKKIVDNWYFYRLNR